MTIHAEPVVTAAVVRAILREAGETVGSRGRVSREQVVAALTLRPRLAREQAVAAGIALGERGRISAASFAEVAATVHI